MKKAIGLAILTLMIYLLTNCATTQPQLSIKTGEDSTAQWIEFWMNDSLHQRFIVPKHFGLYATIDSINARLIALEDYVCSDSIDLAVSWNANTEPDLAGYIIYWGNKSRLYNSSKDVGLLTSYALGKFYKHQDWFFAVTAYDTTGNESGYSKEIKWPITF